MSDSKIVYRIGVTGASCPSAGELLTLKVGRLEAAEAVSLGDDSVLTVLATAAPSALDDIVRAVIEAGFSPRTADALPVTAQAAVADVIAEAEAAAIEAAIEPEPAPEPVRASLVQQLRVNVSDGFYPNHLEVVPGVPVEITFGEGHGCLAHVLFEDFGIDADLTNCGATVRLPGLAPGEYRFSCGMRMVFGTLTARI